MAKRVKKIADDYKWDAASFSLSHFTHQVAEEILTYKVSSRAPRSIEDFILEISPIFDTSTCQQIRCNLASFDVAAGIKCTETFPAYRTIGDWVLHIINIFLEPLNIFDSQASRASQASRSFQRLPDIPHLDGDTGMFDVPIDRTVQQVNLIGDTVLEAWTTNAVTRRLSVMRKDQHQLHHDPENLGPTWTPAQGGGSPVYHGSAIHVEDWPLQFDRTPFKALQARQNPNQMTTDAHNVIFTTFSPLRAFLWATFKGTLPSMTPSARDTINTQNTWVTGGTTYRGVALFKFNATQPAPAGLMHYVIPEGKETEWGTRSLRAGQIGMAEEDAWGCYRDIHGQGGDDFPDLIHGLEYGHQRTALTPSHTNMWRTIWTRGAAAKHLNSQHEATYAISFELGSRPEAPPPPPPPPPPSSSSLPLGKPDEYNGKGKKDGKGNGTLECRLIGKVDDNFVSKTLFISHGSSVWSKLFQSTEKISSP